MSEPQLPRPCSGQPGARHGDPPLVRQIRERRLGSRTLYVQGAGLMLFQSLGGALGHLGDRVAHKWKGWARMRTNPELVAR